MERISAATWNGGSGYEEKDGIGNGCGGGGCGGDGGGPAKQRQSWIHRRRLI